MKHVLAKCPHCGVPIYAGPEDARGLPTPEYVCNCREWARVMAQPVYQPYPVAVPVKLIEPNPWPWWLYPTNGAAAPALPQIWITYSDNSMGSGSTVQTYHLPELPKGTPISILVGS